MVTPFLLPLSVIFRIHNAFFPFETSSRIDSKGEESPLFSKRYPSTDFIQPPFFRSLVSSRVFQGDEKNKIKIRLLIPRVSSSFAILVTRHARFVSFAILFSRRSFIHRSEEFYSEEKMQREKKISLHFSLPRLGYRLGFHEFRAVAKIR